MINQAKFVRNAIIENVRIDGRSLEDMRPYELNFGDHGSGSVSVKLGRTRVHASCVASVVKPHVDKPTRGKLKFKVQYSPTVNVNGRNNVAADRINDFIDRAIKQSNAFHLELLNILTGEKVWSLNVNVHITDDFGNCLDCAFLAAMSALRSHRRPDVTVVGSKVVVHPVTKRRPVALNFQYLPLSVTLAYIENPEDPEQPIFVLDPTQEESDALDGCITYAMDAHGTIVAIEKAGGVPLPPGQISRALRICYAKVQEKSRFVDAQLSALQQTDRQIRDRMFLKYSNPIDAFEQINFKDTPSFQQVKEDSDEEMIDELKLLQPQEVDVSEPRAQGEPTVSKMEIEPSKEEDVKEATRQPTVKQKGLGKRKGLGKKSEGKGGKRIGLGKKTDRKGLGKKGFSGGLSSLVKKGGS